MNSEKDLEENYKNKKNNLHEFSKFAKDVSSGHGTTSHKKAGKKRKIILYLIFLLLIGIIILYFMNSEKVAVVQTEIPVVKAIPVNVQTVSKKSIKFYEKTIGTLDNLDVSSVSSEIAGLVLKVNADIGDNIKANQVLVSIDPSEAQNNVNSQLAEIKRIESLLADALKTKNRYSKLIKDGFVSQSELDTITTKIQTYKEDLTTAKSILENGKIRLSRTKIMAPKSGIVQNRYVTEGTYVAIGAKVFDIVNNSNLTVIASLPETFTYIVKSGQEVDLKIAGIDQHIKSKIKQLKPLIDEQSRNIQVIIDLPTNNLNLKAGATVEVTIYTANKDNVIVVPEKAVVLRMNGKVVYVLTSDNRVIETPVETGVYQDGIVEIISGLKGEETIVLDGANYLSDKATVEVMQPQTTK